MQKFTLTSAALLVCAMLMAGDELASNDPAIQLRSNQKEFLRLEPILFTVNLQGGKALSLPASVGESDSGSLRFEIEPNVQPRSGARPLPLERQANASHASVRDYDLFEWYQFPGHGEFTVRAVFEKDGAKHTSQPISFSISSPSQGDPEASPVARIHHTPWCNYGTNKFCGDTFDLTNRWPDSRLAKYCHYWNGRFLQNNDEYEEAIDSYHTVVKNYPKFALADDAAFGIVECLFAQGKLDEAQQYNREMQKKFSQQAKKAVAGQGQTSVYRLALGMSDRINSKLGLK